MTPEMAQLTMEAAEAVRVCMVAVARGDRGDALGVLVHLERMCASLGVPVPPELEALVRDNVQ